MNPYEELDAKYFWASAVAKRNMFDIQDLWVPKFRVSKATKVATYGSCFAQHFGRALQSRGLPWLISEPTPQGLSTENAKRFNYGVFSARTGNIYTVSLLRQWLGWANGSLAVPEEIWEKDGRFFDPFRPNIEPNGFESETELIASRKVAIKAFGESIKDANVFVFTLGLTESWVNGEKGYEYPMCPGTAAGEFDAKRHIFFNQGFSFIRKALVESIEMIRRINPTIKILLTISPVPLTATMSGNHVLVATVESKSILRSVASAVRRQFGYVDYFPSFEIISSTPFRGSFFEANQRGVNHAGVSFVMESFFQCLQQKFPNMRVDMSSSKGHVNAANALPRKEHSPTAAKASRQKAGADVVCEEELLAAFSKK